MAEIDIRSFRRQRTERIKVYSKHDRKKFRYKKIVKYSHKKFFVLHEGRKIFGKIPFSKHEGKKFMAVSSLMNLSYKLKHKRKIKNEVETYGRRKVSYVTKSGKKKTKYKTKYKLMIRGNNSGLTKTFGRSIPSGLSDFLVQLHVFWKTETRRGRIIQGWGYSNIALIHDAKDFMRKKQMLIASSWGQFCSEYSVRYDEFESAVFLKTRIAMYK